MPSLTLALLLASAAAQDAVRPELLLDANSVELEPTADDRVNGELFEGAGLFWFMVRQAGELGLWTLTGPAADPRPFPIAPLAGAGQFFELRQVVELDDSRALLHVWTDQPFYAPQSTSPELTLRLLVTDGTPDGTSDLLPGIAGTVRGVERFSLEAPDELHFQFQPADSTTAIFYRTDGTQAGTTPVLTEAGEPARTSCDNCLPPSLYRAGNHLVYARFGQATGGTLLALDLSTGASTILFDYAMGLGPVFDPLPIGDRLVFAYPKQDPVTGEPYTLSGPELMVTDGTLAGTRLLVDALPGIFGSNPSPVASNGTVAYFSMLSSGASRELWITDGTAEGTRMVIDLAPGAPSGAFAGTPNPADLGAFLGDRLLFRGSEDGVDAELYSTDGTAAGTVRLTDLSDAPEGSRPRNFHPMPGGLAFSADATGFGRELHVTDGVTTQRLADVAPGPESSEDPVYLDSPGGLLFAASSPADGREVRFAPFAATGATPLTSFSTLQVVPELDSNPEMFIRVAERGFFVAEVQGESGSNAALFVTDGRPAGTLEVVRTSGSILPLGALDRRLVFGMGQDSEPEKIWITDGTPGGTVELGGPVYLGGPPLLDPVAAPNLLQVGRLGLFTGNSPDGLLVTAGSPGSLDALDPFGPDAGIKPDLQARTVQPIRLGALAFFKVAPNLNPWAPSDGARLWASDGTLAGTSPVAPDVLPPADLLQLTRVRDRVFAAYERTDYYAGRHEIWSTDGTNPGTRRELVLTGGVQELYGLEERLIWVGTRAVAGRELVSLGADGEPQTLLETPDGQISIYFIRDDSPRTVHFRVLNTEPESRGLWITDGTPNGTVRVSDIIPDSELGFVKPLGTGRDAAVPSSGEVEGGQVLWKSSGTVGGLIPLAVIESEFGAPRVLGRAGDRILVAHSTPATGVEVFTLPLAATNAFVAEPFGAPCPDPAGPELGFSGDLRPGHAFAFRVDAAAPGAAAFFFGSQTVASLELLGCTLFLPDPILLAAAPADADGSVRVPFALGPDPSLVGARAFAQAATATPTPARPLALTNALELIVGP